jgi:hypothetical protein
VAYEADETFRIVLSAPTGATLGNTFATGTILNDDPLLAVRSAAFGSLSSGLPIPLGTRRRV